MNKTVPQGEGVPTERQEAYETVERHLKDVMAWNDIGAESLYGEATYADPDEVMRWEQVLRELEPPDRSLVALSEDAMWLTRHDLHYPIYHVYVRTGLDYMFHMSLEDTGQSAEDVLRECLEGRS